MNSLLDILPCEVQVTQEIIDMSNPDEIQGCVGYNTLMSFLNSVPSLDRSEINFDGILWGRTFGSLMFGHDPIWVYSSRDMMTVKKPCTIVLSLHVVAVDNSVSWDVTDIPKQH